MKRRWKWTTATVVLLACALVAGRNHRLKAEPVSAQKRRQLLDELSPADTVTVIASLTPDHEGKSLACINLTDDGRQVMLLNPAREQHPAPMASEVERLHAWSPYDRYPAFGQTPS